MDTLREYVRQTIIAKEKQQQVNEGFIDSAITAVTSKIKGKFAGTDKMRQAVSDSGSEDAWSIFKSVVGPGTDEERIKKTLLKRESDIRGLNSEFNDLINNARKEMAISKADFDSINPTKMDQVDFFNHMTTGVSLALMIASFSLGTTGGLVLGPILKIFGDFTNYEMTKAMDRQGGPKGIDPERDRARKEAKLKKATPLFEKLWAKVGGVVQDKSMAEYLRDDGEGEWADWVLKRLG